MFFEPFILAGGIMFYILFAIFAAIMLATVEYDQGWGATWTVIIFAVILSQATDVAVFGYLLSSPIGVLGWVVAYFAAGTVWGVAKWWFYCRKLLDVARDVKVTFLNTKKVQGNDIPDNLRDDFINILTSRTTEYTDYDFPPSAMRHKADWMMWATYWPFSSFWTLLNQPIKHIWQFIYSHLGNMMQKISDAVFSEI